MDAAQIDANKAYNILKHYISNGEISKIAPIAEQLADIFASDARFQNAFAEIEARQGKVQAAIDRYLRVVDNDPLNFTANLKIFAFMSLLREERCRSIYRRWEQSVGDGPQTEDRLVEAYEKYDNAYDLFLGMSLVSVCQGRFERAVQLFDHCLTDPGSRIPPAETVETKYAMLAVEYDDAPFHQDTVERFLSFVEKDIPARVETVIDAACGTGLAANRLARSADHLIGLDLSHEMLALAKVRSLYDQLLCGDMAELMATKLVGTADLVICIGATCYLEDLTSFLAGAAAALKPGGQLCFSDFPARPKSGQRVSRYATFRYCRSSDFVEQKAQLHGFTVSEIVLSTAFSLPSYFYRMNKM